MTTDGAHDQFDEAVRTTIARLAALDRLISAGWKAATHTSTVTLTTTVLGSAEPVRAALAELQPLPRHAKLTARWGSDVLHLEAPNGTSLVVTDSTHGDLRDSFDDDVLTSARQAFAGDASAALQLIADWTVEFTIDTAAVLAAVRPEERWVVLNDVTSLETVVGGVPWWELRRLLQPGPALTVAIRHADPNLRVATRDLVVSSLSQLPIAVAGRALGSSGSAQRHESLPGLPDPAALHPNFVDGERDEADRVVMLLHQRTTAAAWALLASSVTISGDQAELEFFGLQRQSWTLDRNGPSLTREAHSAAFDLWESVVSAGSPDRVLAVRQVVSIYREAPWGHAADVGRSAEALFVALRTDAIGEAFRSQREARALALSVARQTAEATTALAKSAVERALAVFAAIGAIIVARTTKTLTADQAASLRQLLGTFLVVLVPWSFLLEGRPVTMAIGSLKRDLTTFSDLVPASEQAAILQTETVRRARSQAWIARVVVPLAYAAAAIIAFRLRG